MWQEIAVNTEQAATQKFMMTCHADQRAAPSNLISERAGQRATDIRRIPSQARLPEDGVDQTRSAGTRDGARLRDQKIAVFTLAMRSRDLSL